MLVLGSGSPQRRHLLEQAGYRFRVVAPRGAAERGICSQCGPAELVVELSIAKAIDVAAQLRDANDVRLDECTLIACDTVAECGGRILGKPVDEQHARSMLEQLRGSPHRVYSGLCVWHSPTTDKPPADTVQLAVSHLHMDAISDEELDDYLASELWRDKAGAIGYQDRPGWLHLQEGSASNVIGLPMEALTQKLNVK
ncbi:Maf family protein [Pirellulales bacterium]|nr:Maf family protein [Pirellulales bacterium]